MHLVCLHECSPVDSFLFLEFLLYLTSSFVLLVFPFFPFDSCRMINWGHVIGSHAPQILLMGVFVLLAQVVHQVVQQQVHTVGLTQEFSLETISQILHAVKDLFLNFYESLV